jgi:hypothetical protein
MPEMDLPPKAAAVARPDEQREFTIAIRHRGGYRADIVSDSAGIGLYRRAAEPGARGCRFHLAERAPEGEVKGQDPR